MFVQTWQGTGNYVIRFNQDLMTQLLDVASATSNPYTCVGGQTPFTELVVS